MFCVKFIFIFSFKFKFLVVVIVFGSCFYFDVEYVFGGRFEVCDDDIGGFGFCGGVGELFMFLGIEERRKEMK